MSGGRFTIVKNVGECGERFKREDEVIPIVKEMGPHIKTVER